MNDHNLRGGRYLFERMAHRILPPATAFDNHNRLRARAQIFRRRGGQVRRQCDRDVGDRVTLEERLDTTLENAAPRERDQLLRMPRAKAKAPAPGSDDGGNVSAQKGNLIKADLKAGLYQSALYLVRFASASPSAIFDFSLAMKRAA